MAQGRLGPGDSFACEPELGPPGTVAGSDRHPCAHRRSIAQAPGATPCTTSVRAAAKAATVPRTSPDESIVLADALASLPVTPAATTSRVAVDNDRVRVVLFAFDTGEQLTEHTASVPVVVHLLRGTMRFEVAGEAHELTAGDVVYLAAEEQHALEAHEPALLSLVMVRA